ncbi:hypothetical protein B0H11DRAFT_1911911 [Mycena galericulata]|nr:hypothetical protein B0H11DRAFT_1911911 [Mycena galericulata]
MAHRVAPYPTSRHATPGAEHNDSPPPAPAHPHQHTHAPPHHYAYKMPRDSPAGYMYGTPPHAYGHDSRYAAYTPLHQLFPMQQGHMPYPLSAPPILGQRRSMAGPGGPDGGGGPPILVVHTDDALKIDCV